LLVEGKDIQYIEHYLQRDHHFLREHAAIPSVRHRLASSICLKMMLKQSSIWYIVSMTTNTFVTEHILITLLRFLSYGLSQQVTIPPLITKVFASEFAAVVTLL
jgi:hypothetical protein